LDTDGEKASAPAAASRSLIRVTFQNKGLEALVQVTPPNPNPPERIIKALELRGVRDGLDLAAIEALSKKPPEDPVCVARGKAPVAGDNARLEFAFVTDTESTGPALTEDGKVDFRDVNLIQSVVPGQLLVRKKPATEGKAGVSVTGEPIPPTPGKDTHILAGKGVEISPDKTEAYAAIHGIPALVKGRVTVQPVFQVEEVDFSVGNINFQGSVVITGNVNPGFSVKATEDIEVQGNVEQATIEAGGSIRIRGGARSNSQLKAQKDIQARFCDSSSVLESNRDITIQGDAANCTLTCKGKLVIGNRLIGGQARAGELVQASVMGSTAGAATRVEIRQRSDQDEIELLRSQVEIFESAIQDINNRIQLLMSRPSALNAGEIQKLTPQKVQKNIQLQALKAQLEELLTADPNSKVEGKVFVKAEVFPGVTVAFSVPGVERLFKVTSKLHHKTFRIVGGEIVPS
jgi:uncharacterized protein (DUF342 family)